MIRTFLFLAIFFVANISSAQQKDSLIIRKLFNEVLNRGKCYATLNHLCNQIGGRLSASPEAALAISYTAQQFYNFGYDTVYLQAIIVPHWVRGEKEKGWIESGGKKTRVRICALGQSIATDTSGLKAKVIEVQNFKELESLGKDKIKGKIVFYNRPMEPTYINTGRAYGEAGNQRGRGPLEAARYGAVGVIVRSLTLAHDTFPHTGYTHYVDTVPRIPACAISTVDADELSRMLKSDSSLNFYFRQTCIQYFDEISYNVIGEVRGTEKKDEVVVVGGHLDSWDLGDGAHDDGTGIVMSMESIRLIREIGLRPKRTLRCVLFMNEENGTRGAKMFAEESAKKKEKIIAAIESDGGGFTPRGFHVDDSLSAARMQKWLPLLKPYGIGEIEMGHSGTDVEPLKNNGAVTIGYAVDNQRYFDIHHTAADTFDKVNRRELELGAGCMSALVWLLSEYGIQK
jgi:hypothetical protein